MATVEPPRPRRKAPGLDASFRCEALRCVCPVRCCLLRQKVAERQVTHDRHRGTSPDFPSCLHCPQGEKIRKAAGVALLWRGEGAGGRTARTQLHGERARQEAARRRLEAVGLLDAPPSVDEPPQDELV